jgi:predicted dienelactone hydrolase
MLIKILKKILQGIGLIILTILVLLIALIGYLNIAHNQPLILPSPTGLYSVGRTEYDWTDNSRIDTLSDIANVKRELAVWLWYPATVSQQDSTAPYLPPDWVTARNNDQGMAGGIIESRFSSIHTHSFANVPLTGAQSTYPVIIMEPGMGPIPTDYTVYAENLASHGYIVVGINPTYTSNVIVFPDGRVALRSQKGTIPDSADTAAADQDASRIGKVWTEDVLFVMDQLQSLNADQSSLFYNKLDLAHIGVFGHSFGGATAASVCEIEPRCKAGADLDGTLFSYQASATLQAPFMFMAEDNCGKNCDTLHQAYSASNSAAYYLSIKGTRHFNFSDMPLRLPPLSSILLRQLGYIGSIQPARGLEISNAYLVAFFDQYLKGTNSELLQSSTSPYSEVQFEKH